MDYFLPISDMLFFAIKTQNLNIASSVSSFMYGVFKEERLKESDTPIVYPIAYYDTVKKATEELAILRSKKLSFLEVRTVGGIWLLGELGNHKISKDTYSVLWKNLLTAVRYKNDDMVLHYWNTADQYFSFYLNLIGK